MKKSPAILAIAFCFPALVLSAPPRVTKVEPPGWWAGHSIQPVRVLVRGAGLQGARLESTFRTQDARVNSTGTYLFADVFIPAGTKPGSYPFRVVTAEGSVQAPFEVLPALERRGRFQGFSSDDVIYLLMPDRFANGDPANDNPPQSSGLLDRSKGRYYHGGDLKGIIGRLPYLKDLGVTAIWLNPIYDNNDRLNTVETYDGQAITDYHGYGAVDYYAVDEHLGDVRLFRELVDAAHQAGIKVIQDQVANHTGPMHPWVKDPPTPTWHYGSEARHLANTWQTWTLMDPHASYEVQKATLEGWFLNILPDLNQDDEEVKRYLIQNTLWWIGVSGIDGIRQDTLPYVHRRFWRDWMAAIKREYPSFRVVGEMFDGNPAVVSFFQGGRKQFDGIDSGIDTVFDFPLFFPLRRAFSEGKPVREVAAMLAHDHLYPNPSVLVTFLGLHDVPRFMNTPGATVDGLKLAFTFLMTTRGTPLIYYGDEIGMPGGGDPDNRRDFPGGWPADAHNAFHAAGRTDEENAVFDHVRRLAQLRAELEPLRRGRLIHLITEEQQYVYARAGATTAVVTAINNSPQPAEVAFDARAANLPDAAVLEDRLGVSAPVVIRDGRARVLLPARSAVVLAVR